MRRDLTKRYSSLFEKPSINPISFVHDIYQTGKFRELGSFIVWEIFHKLRIFPKQKYLNFSQGYGLTLGHERYSDMHVNEESHKFFNSRGLRIKRCDHNWKRIFIDNNGNIYGCLYPDDRKLYKWIDNRGRLMLLQSFPESIKSIVVSSQGTIFVCVPGAVYKSVENEVSFRKALDLGSSESFFRFNNGMTETPCKTLIIGEYGNVWENNRWKQLAYVYFSSDNGETWERSDYLIGQGINKHVHMVKYSRLLNKLFLADGDNKKKLWVSDSVGSFEVRNVKWKAVNKYHIQMGGYTSAVETEEKIFFGTDYQGGTNFIVETSDGLRFTRSIVPDPYRRSPIDNMVRRKSKKGTEIWANLPFSTAHTKCLLMYTADDGKSWNKVIEYTKPAHSVSLISSSHEIRDELYLSIENVRAKDRVVYRISDAE